MVRTGHWFASPLHCPQIRLNVLFSFDAGMLRLKKHKVNNARRVILRSSATGKIIIVRFSPFALRFLCDSQATSTLFFFPLGLCRTSAYTPVYNQNAMAKLSPSLVTLRRLKRRRRRCSIAYAWLLKQRRLRWQRH